MRNQLWKEMEDYLKISYVLELRGIDFYLT